MANRAEKNRVSVERVIPAAPEKIFALLSRPDRHVEFDGSGTVQHSRGSGARLQLGSTFGMSMKVGARYSTRNEVVELEQDRRIAWRTFQGPFPAIASGRTWRYELEPVEGGTLVRETWDISTEAAPARPLVRRMAETTRRNMDQTLARIEEIVTRDAQH